MYDIKNRGQGKQPLKKPSRKSEERTTSGWDFARNLIQVHIVEPEILSSDARRIHVRKRTWGMSRKRARCVWHSQRLTHCRLKQLLFRLPKTPLGEDVKRLSRCCRLRCEGDKRVKLGVEKLPPSLC